MKKIVLVFVAGLLFCFTVNSQINNSWSWNSGVKKMDTWSKVLIGDVNGDGKDDLVGIGDITKSNAGYVYVGLSNGTGFNFWSWNSGKKLIEKDSHVALGDVNGDGKDDMIVTGSPGGQWAGLVYVGLSDGIGYSSWTLSSGFKYFDDDSKLYTGDVNGDGKDDLISLCSPKNSKAGYLYFALSNGKGFTEWTWNSNKRIFENFTYFTVGDANGDGKDDFWGGGLDAAYKEGLLYMGISNGKAFVYNVSKMGEGYVFESVLCGDVNGDGLDDLFFSAKKGFSTISYYLITSSSNGNPASSIINFEGLNMVVALGDVNGDKKDDLIGIGKAGEKNAGWVYVGLSGK